MTKRPRQPQTSEGNAAADQSQRLDGSLDAQAQARITALQQENARLQAELQAYKQSEAIFRQREEQFRTLVNNVPGAVYRAAFDHDWTIAFISDAIAKLSGYPATDFIQNQVQSFNKICHPDDLEDANRSIRAAIEAKQPFMLEYRNIRSDGEIVWVCEQGHGVYDEDGKGLWVDGIVLDITALKQTEDALRRSEERLKLITDSLPVCISYVDRHHHLQFANKTYETWFGLSVPQICGKHLSEVIGEAAYQLVQGYIERALAGETTTYEMVLPYRFGGHRYVRSILVPDVGTDQQVQGYYALVMDASAQQAALHERKRAEEAVKQQAERDRLFSAIAQRIRQSLNLDDILNTTVHEVRCLLKADRAMIYRYQPGNTAVITVESVGNSWRSLLGEVLSDSRLTIEAFMDRDRNGQSIVADIHKAGLEPAYVDILVRYQVQAHMLLPIWVGERLWGLLIVNQCAAPRVWQPWEVDLLTQLATQLTIAIQQSELFQQVQQLNAVLEGQIQEHISQLRQALAYEALLKRITDSVRDSLDETQIFQTVVQELAIGLQLYGCSGGLYDFDQQVLTITSEHICHNLPPALGKQLSIASEPAIYGQMLQGQHLQFCPLSEFSNTIRPIQTKYTILACPIFIALETDMPTEPRKADVPPEMIGDLWLFRPKDASFSEMDIRLVKQVTNQCAIAIRQARLYQAAQAQVIELERLNQLKDDFLSTVSHELRTPMSSIKMATQMLEVTLFNREGSQLNHEPKALTIDSATCQKVSRYFQILKDEGEREIQLINDLLDLSRLDSGRDPLFLSTHQLQTWLPHLAEPFLERTRTQQQTLSIAVAPDVPAMTTDFSYLERVLGELLHNACKYTSRGEAITVTAYAVLSPEQELNPAKPAPGLSVDRATVEITVTNSGVEIPAAERDRIFDKFYRIPHNDPWKHGGTGLGLALVKKLVERLDGDIWVDSGNGQTRFVLQFPSALG